VIALHPHLHVYGPLFRNVCVGVFVLIIHINHAHAIPQGIMCERALGTGWVRASGPVGIRADKVNATIHLWRKQPGHAKEGVGGLPTGGIELRESPLLFLQEGMPAAREVLDRGGAQAQQEEEIVPDMGESSDEEVGDVTMGNESVIAEEEEGGLDESMGDMSIGEPEVSIGNESEGGLDVSMGSMSIGEPEVSIGNESEGELEVSIGNESIIAEEPECDLEGEGEVGDDYQRGSPAARAGLDLAFGHLGTEFTISPAPATPAKPTKPPPTPAKPPPATPAKPPPTLPATPAKPPATPVKPTKPPPTPAKPPPATPAKPPPTLPATPAKPPPTPASEQAAALQLAQPHKVRAGKGGAWACTHTTTTTTTTRLCV
jgi:hypothetical protein